MRHCIFILFLLFGSVILISQEDIAGFVYDFETGKPLSFANVFISNTTIGSVTDSKGGFRLEKIPLGAQELVISFLGYETISRKMHVHAGVGQKSFTAKLIPLPYSISEVVISSESSKKRKKYVKKFEKAFFGSGPNADACNLLNPEVLRFENEKDVFKVRAVDLVKVENTRLGYNLNILLQEFEINGSIINYAGKPLFNERAITVDQDDKLERNRLLTFSGSSRHFFESLVANGLADNGFKIYSALQNSDGNFNNIKKLTEKDILKVDHEKLFVVLPQFLKIEYVNRGLVTNHRGFNSERPSGRSDFRQRSPNIVDLKYSPASFIFTERKTLSINMKGRLRDPSAVLTYGEWANEGVADWLPFDYLPTLESIKGSVKKNIKESMLDTLKMKGFYLYNLLIPIAEIKDGGPPKDGIPSIDNPKFITDVAKSTLDETEPVLGLTYNGVSKAYPQKILDRHEVVNDEFKGVKVAITFCPLCGSGIAILSKINGTERSFGVSGLLFNSDVLLYDRENESLWSQILGKAVSGKDAGQTFEMLPLEHTSWKEWLKRNPETLVLSTETGYKVDYDQKAYEDYLESNRLMFSVSHENNILGRKEKVIGLEINGKFIAYPFQRLAKMKSPLYDNFNGTSIRVFYDKKSDSARILNDQEQIIPAVTLFWFAWYTFHPDTELYELSE